MNANLIQELETKPAHSLAVLDTKITFFGTEEQKDLASTGWRAVDSYGDGELCIMIYQKYLY